MIEMMTNQPNNILAFTAHGQVTGEDYESVLIPAVEAKLEEIDKIRLLYHLDSDFSGFEAEALWDDAKVGLQHLTAWEKIAVVSDNQWMVGATKVFGFIMPCPVKVFAGNQLENAIEWLKA
jgi:hypothetical protein